MTVDLSPLFISLKVSLIAMSFVVVLGILAARCAMEVKGSWQWVLDVLFTLPMILPPTVVGFVLLMVSGRNKWLNLVFTQKGAILAASVVAFPLMYRAVKGAFEQIDEEVIWAARTLGLTETRIFFKIMIPEALPGIIAGSILAFARALGEFGATLMVAGNIPEVTQTMPLAIYFATSNGNMKVAAFWTVMITGISCMMLGIMNRWNRTKK